MLAQSLLAEDDLDVVGSFRCCQCHSINCLAVCRCNYLLTIRIPDWFVNIKFTWLSYILVKFECWCERAVFCGEEHINWGTLEGVNVCSCQGFEFSSLRSSIGVVHAFLGTTCCGEVTEGLIHPIGPGSQIFIKCISRVVDFYLALFTVEASSKLSIEQRNTESLCIFRSCLQLSEVESSALFSLIELWLTIVANTCWSLATIRVIVQNLSVSLVKTTWAVWEPYRNGKPSKKGLRVWELSWLKENHFDVINFSDCLVSLHSNWE